ncbi:hypothetical protein EJ06DRAFT_321217 [Trichodelitschia bisporula]|uniref:Uncharacterized protein n=1 Tax=Trichodelitschia bisporula TaxID=703511 RepID=A0A6G1I4Z8_9PEZI|nr:hypothetical protein EJ06DRAFT_321217 [Trichodelitschia bisporula]
MPPRRPCLRSITRAWGSSPYPPRTPIKAWWYGYFALMSFYGVYEILLNTMGSFSAMLDVAQASEVANLAKLDEPSAPENTLLTPCRSSGEERRRCSPSKITYTSTLSFRQVHRNERIATFHSHPRLLPPPPRHTTKTIRLAPRRNFGPSVTSASPSYCLS